MTFMRFIHKWIGVLLGIQVILWMLSGFIMSFYDKDMVEGHHLMKQVERGSLQMAPVGDLTPILEQLPTSANIISVSTDFFRGRSVIKVVTTSGTYMYDALISSYIEIDEALATQIAIDDFAGDGEVVAVSRITAPTMETRESAGPGWRVDFNNDENSSLYISAETGQIWERRHDRWRQFDIFWVLHIMDYENRKSFNNWIVILSAWVTLWIGLSGIIILVENIRQGDFNLVGKWRAKNRQFSFALAGGESFDVSGGQTLFDTLASKDIHLPTSCGGGGSCGLCRVVMNPAPKPMAADKREISDSDLEQGYRLSCQHRNFDGTTITLPAELAAAKSRTLEVVSAKLVTPYIREIEFRDISGEQVGFYPGCYFQFTIPPYELSLPDMDISEVFNKQVSNGSEIKRTYSVANAENELDGNIKVNVRLVVTSGETLMLDAGLGSSYMHSLKVGDQIPVLGPFGDFKLKSNEREKIFIGGGAGMAPIRSMIRHLLTVDQSNAKISFWYGARTRKDLYNNEEFDELDKTYGNFSWHYALSDQGEGFIHSLAYTTYLKSHPDLASCDFYLCGPPAMLKATLQMLSALGVKEKQIALDDFGI